MKPFFGLICFLIIVGGIWLLVILSPAKSPHGHNPHPTPTPTPSPTPSPSATPTPTVTPTPSPVPTPPSVALAWDPAADQSDPAIGYFFKWGFLSGAENQVVTLGNVTTYRFQVTSGQTYFFVVTAFDSSHNESLPSNELTYTAP